MGKVYALLVGINSYPSFKKLQGCLNDIDHVRDFLVGYVPAADLAVEVLKEADATHAAITRQFREHLGRAGPGDTAYFHYAGHGAQAGAAAAFKPYFASGQDEGILCWDTSWDNGMMLADKEFAVLIDELATKGANITATLDCCHSGSGTRDASDDIAFAIRAADVFEGGHRDLEPMPMAITPGNVPGGNRL